MRNPLLTILISASSVPCAEGRNTILCLHGRGGGAFSFLAHNIAPLRDTTAACYGIPGRARRATAWKYDAIDSEDASGGWWSYPEGERSYSAKEFVGAEASIAAVEAELATGLYCGLLGFSQGAALAACIAARVSLGEGNEDAARHLRFAVICGTALPQPFRPVFEKLQEAGDAAVPTLHCLSRADTVNPPGLGEELARSFGATAQVLWHDAGHALPPKDKLTEVAAWLDQFGQ